MHSTKIKKHTIRFASSKKNSFDSFLNIKKRTKKVETRAATIKYRNIKAGDELVLVCGKEKFEKKIKHAEIFKSIADMLKKYKIKDIMPELSTKQELEKAYYSYTGYKEKIKKCGLIALEI